MNELMKLKKIELVEKIEKARSEILELKKLDFRMNNLTKKQDVLEKELENRSDKLKTIQQSVSTVIAIKFPEESERLLGYNYVDTHSPKEGLSEEFLLLRYINSLCM